MEQRVNMPDGMVRGVKIAGNEKYLTSKANVSNSAVATNIISAIIPAGDIKDGDEIEITGLLKCTCDDEVNTFTLSLKYGDTSFIFDSGDFPTGQGNNSRELCKLTLVRAGNDLYIRNGALNSNWSQRGAFNSNVITGDDKFANLNFNSGILTNPGFDTEKTLAISFQWGTASEDSVLTVLQGSIRKI